MIAVFALALVLRVGAIVAVGFTSTGFGDAEAYMRTAEIVLRTGAYPDNAEGLPVFRAPGYPAFLIVSTLGHPRAVAADKLWNALLGAVTAILLARLAGRISGSRRVAVIAGVLAAVNPAFVYLATDVQSENLTILLLVLFAGELLSATDPGSIRSALAAGALLGFAALTRPVCLSLAPFLAAPLFGHQPRRATSRAGAAALIGLLLALVPWSARNALRFGALMPVSDQFGVSLWLGNGDLNAAYYRLKAPVEYVAFMSRFQVEVDSGRIGAIAKAHANPAHRSRAFVADVLAWTRSHPREAAELMSNKAFDWLRPWANPLVWPRRVVVATGVWYGALFLFAALGLAATRPRGLVAFALAYLALSMLVHVAIIVVLRYRMVFWDPILIVFAAVAVARMFDRFVSERTRGEPSLSARRAGPPSPRR